MKSQELYAPLLLAMSSAERIAHALWADATASGQHGLAAFFDWEAEERHYMARQVVNHMAEHGIRVMVPALPAPPAEFKSPAEAVLALHEHDKKICASVQALYDASVTEGMRVFFLSGLVRAAKEQLEEVEGVHAMVANSPGDQMAAVNAALLDKYGVPYCPSGD